MADYFRATGTSGLSITSRQLVLFVGISVALLTLLVTIFTTLVVLKKRQRGLHAQAPRNNEPNKKKYVKNVNIYSADENIQILNSERSATNK